MSIYSNDHGDDDAGDQPPSRRTPTHLARSEALPSVETALDDFISRANTGQVDVAGFTAEGREQKLLAAIADLTTRLADANARARAEPERSRGLPSGSWGAIATAFLVGCIATFAVLTWMRPDDRAPSVPAAIAPVQPAPVPAPVPAPAPAPAPPASPRVEPPAPKPATATASATKPNPTKGTKATGAVPDASPPGSGRPTPPASAGAGSADLYDPF